MKISYFSNLGGHLLDFRKFFNFAFNLNKSHYLRFLHNFDFQKFFVPWYPQRVPIPPMSPAKPKISKILTSPKSWPKPIPNVFLRYPKICWKILPCPRRLFFAIFSDFLRYGQKMKNIEFRAPLSTAIALKVFLCIFNDKSESEINTLGSQNTTQPPSTEFTTWPFWIRVGLFYPPGYPRRPSILLRGMFHYISSYV